MRSLLCASGSLLSQGDSPPRLLGRGSIVSHNPLPFSKLTSLVDFENLKISGSFKTIKSIATSVKGLCRITAPCARCGCPLNFHTLLHNRHPLHHTSTFSCTALVSFVSSGYVTFCGNANGWGCWGSLTAAS